MGDLVSWGGPGQDGTIQKFGGLRWTGHEFLETIRDPDVWRMTKQGASQVGGLSLDFMKQLATAYLKQKAKDARSGSISKPENIPQTTADRQSSAVAARQPSTTPRPS